MMRSAAVLVIVAAGADAFTAPSAFMGAGVAQRAVCNSGVVMSASEEGAVSRRSALAGILTGALAIPSVASAFVEGAQGRGSEKKGAQGAKDFNWQLRQNQGITDVASSSMAGTRTSAFGKSIFQNEKNAVNLPRPGLTSSSIDQIDILTEKLGTNSAITKNGYKTSNKLFINPAYGGSAGIYTGAK